MRDGFNDFFSERIELEVMYICDYGYTVRQAAKLLGISKSTVYIDVTERLNNESKKDYLRVKKVLEYHRSVRHLRGGEATKRRYEKLRESKN